MRVSVLARTVLARTVLALTVLLLSACDTAETPDAGPDGGADGGPTEMTRSDPMPPSWPCPDGWQTVDVDGVPVCDPGAPLSCPPGRAHFLGSEGCAPVGGACPDGDFADGLPAEGVRFVQPGASGDGTRAAPFGTIAAALAGAPAGTTVALAKGTYAERLRLASGVRVRGACAEQTIFAAPGSGGAAIEAPAGVVDAHVEGVSVRDVDQIGVVVRGALTLRSVAVEGAQLFGVVVLSGTLDAEALLVRGTRLGPASDNGFGVAVVEGASATLRQTVLEGNHQVGLAASGGATVSVEDLATRSSVVGAVPDFAAGIVVEGAAQLTGTRVQVEDSRSMGVLASGGGAVSLSDALIRTCRAQGANMGFGVGALSGAVDLRRARITDAQGTAVQTTDGGDITLTDVLVDRVVPPPGRTDWAVGLSVASRGTLAVERVLLQRVAAAAVSVIGQAANAPGDARLSGSDLTVRDVEDLGLTGIGLYVADTAEAELSRVAIERTTHAGIAVIDASLSLSDVRVSDTAFNVEDGFWGRGLEAVDSDVSVERARFEGQHEAAVIVGGGTASFTGLEVAAVSERGCAEDSCSAEPGGTGLAVLNGAEVTVRDFDIVDAPLCGVQIAADGSLDLFDGTIRQAAVGVCVQVDGYELARLANDVRYEETGTSIQATSHYVPEVNDPLP